MSNSNRQQPNPVPRGVTVRHFPDRGISIAYTQEGDLVRVGVAATAPNDQFNRRIGREVALGRLNCPRDIEWRYEFRTQATDRVAVSQEVATQMVAEVEVHRQELRHHHRR